jgi:hypothetical protein
VLLLGSANTLTLAGITVYPDDADPLQYWYLPGPVQLARDSTQRPHLTLIQYVGRADIDLDDGGFLLFEVNLRLDPDIERQMRSRLRSIAGGAVNLSPVQFDEGTVKCVALDLEGSGGTVSPAADGTFTAVEKINGATTPSLAGDNNAIFSLKLSKAGATIMRETLEQGGQPVGVIYALLYTGLRPALEVKITADMDRVYQQFSASLEAQIYYVRAGIDAGFEKLVQDQAIKIDVKNFSTAQDRAEKEKWALDFFKENLLAQWFQPTLTPGKLAGTPAAASPISDVIALGQRLRPAQPAAPSRPDTTPQTPPSPPQTIPREGDPDHATGSQTQERLQPQPATPLAPDQSPSAGTGVAGASPTLPPAGQAPLSFDPSPIANLGRDGINISPVSFKLKFIRQEERRTLTFEYNRAEAVQVPYNPQGFFSVLTRDLNRAGMVVSVDLDSAFFRNFDVEVSKRIDFTQIGLNSSQIILDYGDTSTPEHHKHEDFLFTRDDPTPTTRRWVVPMANIQANSYLRHVEYNFDPQSSWEGASFEVDRPDELTADRRYEINPYEHLSFLRVEARPDPLLDWGIIQDIEATLALEGDPNRKKSFTFREHDTPRTWLVRSAARHDTTGERVSQRYSYQLLYRLTDGQTRTITSPTPISSEVLNIANPFLGTLTLEVRSLLSPNVRLAILDIDYVDGSYRRRLSLDLDPSTTSQAKLFRLAIPDPTKRSFSYAITLIGTDSTVTQRPAVETDDPRIFVS